MPDKFTPGPWIAERHPTNHPDLFEYSIKQAYQHEGEPHLYGIVGGIDCEHSARLMAAAPELLVALRHAADFIATCQREGCPAGPVAVPSIIRDAITKASGE